MPYKLYNLEYKTLTGETVHPSRCGIKFINEVNQGDQIMYNGVLLLVEEVKGLLIVAIEQTKTIQVGRD